MSSPNSASFDFTTQLKAIPLKNERAEVLESGEGFLIIGVKLKYEGFMLILSKALSMHKIKKYRIDGISLTIYNEIDGKRSVENLIDLLMERYKLTFFEARGLICLYLNMLMRRGIVAVAIRQGQGV